MTIDDDIMAKLKEEMQSKGKSFKEALNEKLRQGLNAKNGPAKKKPVKFNTFPLGEFEGLDYDNVYELIETAEGPLYK